MSLIEQVPPELLVHATDEEVRELFALEQASDRVLIELDLLSLESDQPYYRRDPVLWAKDKLGVTLWSKQAEIPRALVDHRQVAVKSCHGPGKSFVSGLSVLWWIDTRERAFAVTTAPTDPQVGAILWREINRLYDQADRNGYPLPGRMNLKEWYVGNQMVAMGRKPSDYSDTAFQGLHDFELLLIFDEAGGIYNTLWAAGVSLTTTDESRWLVIGNPDAAGTQFEKVCKPDSGWHTIKIAAHDTPHFTGEAVGLPEETRRGLVTPKWVDDVERMFGKDSPVYISKVLAEFPQADANVVVCPIDYIAPCQVPTPHPDDELLPVELGVDPGAGGDLTVIYERRGLEAGREWHGQNGDPQVVLREIVAAINETGARKVKIDSIGIGWALAGWLQSLRNKAHLAEIQTVNVSEKANDDAHFVNKRSEVWWAARERSRTKIWDLSKCDDVVIDQLTAPHYSTDLHGRIKVEPKDETKKRLGRSPDFADAINLAFHVEAPRHATMIGRTR